VTHAELLAGAAFIEGRHAQAFPTFGSERIGAPVLPPNDGGISYGQAAVAACPF
jgi:hypothetical protein